MTKYANFQLYSAYPAGFIWKSRQLRTYLYGNESDFSYIKRFFHNNL